MSVSESQLRAKSKHNSKIYDQRMVRFPKGTIIRLKALARKNNCSLNSLICSAIELVELATDAYYDDFEAAKKGIKKHISDKKEAGDWIVI